MGNTASSQAIAETLLTKTDAASKYQPKGDYPTNATLQSNYLRQTDASNLLPKALASTTYLTQADASSKYLPYTSAESTYLSKASATSDYLSKAGATSDYLSKASATSDYLSKAGASDYMLKTQASNDYLSKASATTTYLSQTDAQTKTVFCANGTCNVPTGSSKLMFPWGDTTKLGKPSATGTAGARVLAWGDGSKYFYGTGVDDKTLWFSTDTAEGNFRYYNQDKEIANINATGVNTSGDVNATNVKATASMRANDVLASGNVSATTLTAGTINARDVVVSNTIVAPNVYNKAEVGALIDTKTQSLVNAGTLSDLATKDTVAKNLTVTGQLAIDRSRVLRMAGAGDPIHTIGHAAAYGVSDQDGPVILGWGGNNQFPFRGSLSVGTNNNGAVADVRHAMRWDGSAKASFPQQINAQDGIRIGGWNIKEINGELRIFRDGMVEGGAGTQGSFRFAQDGNFSFPRVIDKNPTDPANNGYNGHQTWLGDYLARTVQTDRRYTVEDPNDGNTYLKNPRSLYKIELGANGDNRTNGTWKLRQL